MNTKRKYAAIVGVLAMIGVGLWMRELASWRPKRVLKAHFPAERLRFSRDGKLLLIQGYGDATILNLEKNSLDSDAGRIRNFDKNHGLETFPRIWLDRSKRRYSFSVSPQQSIELKELAVTNEDFGRDDEDATVILGESVMLRPDGGLRFGWSKSRREVYGEVDAVAGEIWIWDWKSGKLKRRVRYAQAGDENAVFSPDGKWLIAVDADKIGNRFLRRYDVQSGKRVETINQHSGFPEFGFSPDGQIFWFVQGNPNQPKIFNLLRADNYQWLGGANCAGPVKWVSNRRAGIVAEKNFIWHDGVDSAGNNRFTYLPGPFKGVTDWVLSPDGNWIYAAEQSGVIRRWRAR